MPRKGPDFPPQTPAPSKEEREELASIATNVESDAKVGEILDQWLGTSEGPDNRSVAQLRRANRETASVRRHAERARKATEERHDAEAPLQEAAEARDKAMREEVKQRLNARQEKAPKLKEEKTELMKEIKTLRASVGTAMTREARPKDILAKVSVLEEKLAALRKQEEELNTSFFGKGRKKKEAEPVSETKQLTHQPIEAETAAEKAEQAARVDEPIEGEFVDIAPKGATRAKEAVQVPSEPSPELQKYVAAHQDPETKPETRSERTKRLAELVTQAEEAARNFQTGLGIETPPRLSPEEEAARIFQTGGMPDAVPSPKAESKPTLTPAELKEQERLARAAAFVKPDWQIAYEKRYANWMPPEEGMLGGQNPQLMYVAMGGKKFPGQKKTKAPKIQKARAPQKKGGWWGYAGMALMGGLAAIAVHNGKKSGDKAERHAPPVPATANRTLEDAGITRTAPIESSDAPPAVDVERPAPRVEERPEPANPNTVIPEAAFPNMPSESGPKEDPRFPNKPTDTTSTGSAVFPNRPTGEAAERIMQPAASYINGYGTQIDAREPHAYLAQGTDGRERTVFYGGKGDAAFTAAQDYAMNQPTGTVVYFEATRVNERTGREEPFIGAFESSGEGAQALPLFTDPMNGNLFTRNDPGSFKKRLEAASQG